MEVALTHTQRVLRLYRRSLKNALSWEVNRKLYRIQALQIRERFEKNRNVTNMELANQILQEAEVRSGPLGWCMDGMFKGHIFRLPLVHYLYCNVSVFISFSHV